MRITRTPMATLMSFTVSIHRKVLLSSSDLINARHPTRSIVLVLSLTFTVDVAALYALSDSESIRKFFTSFMLPNRLTFVPRSGQEPLEEQMFISDTCFH